MDARAAQSMIRFGFGTGSGAAGKADLKAELAGPDPGLASGVFAGLPSGWDAVNAQHNDALARKAIMLQGLPLQGNFKSQSTQLYRADGTAQIGWALATPAGFRERLVWFWANHFSVSTQQNESAGFIGPMIREAIRPNITGKFSNLVLAVERHPAMLRYLDNQQSIGPDSKAGLHSGQGLNENLGRECMELHTVGLAAGYSQADVTNMAKILTGWGISAKQTADTTGFIYHPNAHEPGAHTVMGQSFDGGEQAGIDALSFLATYPTTYQLLARKLVTHFVADAPPAHAVAQIAGILMETGGDLAAASAALIDLPDAWIPGRKLKTPFDYMVSMLRAAPPPADQPAPDYFGILNKLGQPLWSAPLPNGWPDQAADWAGSDAIMARVDFAYTYAARVDAGNAGPQPADIAQAALGPLLRPETASAMANAGSRREALTLLFASPEFQRR